MKRFLVVIPKPDGGVEVHAMKQWLRQHPDQVPPGLDATASTSHQLRGALKRSGWSIDENESEVRLVPPGSGVVDANVNAVLGGEPEAEDGSDDLDPRFGLEYQLRDFLAQNISTIDVNGKRLRLFVDPSGRDGIEYPTAVGPIDLLAVDDAGAFFVFELKRARSPDHAIGQLTRYMGWVRQTIGRDRAVNGVIVAKEISDALRYAVSVVPNVSLFEYEVEFTLRPAHEIAP
jgi:RecB family endonuclease NucS